MFSFKLGLRPCISVKTCIPLPLPFCGRPANTINRAIKASDLGMFAKIRLDTNLHCT